MAEVKTPGRSRKDTPMVTNSIESNFVRVNASTSDADVIRFDGEGKGLVFSVEDDFPSLPDEVLRQLGADNRTRYSHAREIHMMQAAPSSGLEGIEVDLQLVSKPTDKLKVFTLPDNLVERWVRPENIRDKQAKGWKVAGNEAKSYIGTTGGVHKIGRIGQDELILMVRDKKSYQQAQLKKAEENSRKAGFANATKVVTSEAAQAGLSDYNEAKDGKKRPWKDLATEAGEE